ncbi:MAG: WYL domain-containing protein [Vallitalea sp.]|jgi:hypothetical protein|nr:WYL domain-containing protein [Vallitalea sp.]
MTSFNELIKNYEKIRDYLRDFHIYGYKCRNDFDSKSGRSYDNERRRIENYLSGYIGHENSIRGKKLFITADTIDLEENPLFVTWMTKTFTKNDVMLHFIILDILNINDGITLNEIIDIIVNEYLSRFEEIKIPDNMTIRNKLKELENIGFLHSIKNGKALHYYISKQEIYLLSREIINKLLHTCGYYQNVFPAGVLGNFIRYRVDSSIVKEPLFSFRHIYLAHTLDDEILLNILIAIGEHRNIEFKHANKRNSKVKIRALPLKILDNVSSGRRYLAAYDNKNNCFVTYRIDNIKEVIVKDICDGYDEYVKNLVEILNKSWGVTISNKKNLEKLEVTLIINNNEDYILKRINREGKHGTIEKIGENTYLYTIEVIDSNEMVPWLRTLIGRIISFKCTNKIVEEKFIRDIDVMYEMYRGVGHEPF